MLFLPDKLRRVNRIGYYPGLSRKSSVASTTLQSLITSLEWIIFQIITSISIGSVD